MLDRTTPLALYMEGASNDDNGKMGFGVLRYSPNPIACVIDSEATVKDVAETGRTSRSAPIVATVEEAIARGAKAMVLGIAPSGGLIPPEWWKDIDVAVANRLSIINGLHDLVAPRYRSLTEGQWIWDIRQEPEGLTNGTALAERLAVPRVLMIGTDMAVGKMTAGLEIVKAAQEQGIGAEFVATGQIGITVTGQGVPLDAIRVDFASGAIEREVLRAAEVLGRSKGFVLIEGQGALSHPSSSATLPLLRGACPTHLILCHRAGQKTLRRLPNIAIPDLREYARLYENLGEALGAFLRPKTVAVALNTSHLDDTAAQVACDAIEVDTGWPCTDPVRHGAKRLVDSIT